MNRGKILVVEDNALNQKLVCRFLEAKGFAPVVMETTAQAEAYLAQNQPDLVLMDVSLPGEDGLSLVRRIRARGEAALPIIALTAHAMTGDREVALAAGCNDYITKPVELRELHERVLAQLGGGGRVKEAAP